MPGNASIVKKKEKVKLMNADAGSYLDILIYAIISGVLFFALFNVLGKPLGRNDKQDPDQRTFYEVDPAEEDVKTSDDIKIDHYGNPQIEKGIRAILAFNESFQMDHFLTGAKGAYMMIISALAEGDRDTLKNLLTPKLYTLFDKDLKAREKREERVDAKVEKVKSVDVESVIVKGAKASVTLIFDADHTNVTYDKDGDVLAGDPDLYARVRDTFTFEQDLKSNDPIWRVSETKSEDVA